MFLELGILSDFKGEYGFDKVSRPVLLLSFSLTTRDLRVEPSCRHGGPAAAPNKRKAGTKNKSCELLARCALTLREVL
jgi:hypothetical protein